MSAFFCDQSGMGFSCRPGQHHPIEWTRKVSVGNEDEHEQTDMVCDSCEYFIDEIERVDQVPADYYSQARLSIDRSTT